MIIPDFIARLTLSISSQMVAILALAAGLILVLARSDSMLILGLLAAYLAAAVLLAGTATSELAVVALLVGIFVALVMQLTAADRRSQMHTAPNDPTTAAVRFLVTILMVWFAASLGVFSRPPDPWQLAEVWLLMASAVALLTTTDPFRVGIALLVITAAAMVFFATGTSESSLLVEGLIASAAFAIALSTSHLALEPGEGRRP
ncbi:MAG: hypothetical protein GXX93_05835 [Anaerolineae bacterium]|nr:hypothetical protein [Anaerolineae bacterium]